MTVEKLERHTIRDVANAAGVSVSTVSKYLTGRPYVSEETAERIREAVERLGFRPDGRGRALATGRTQVLGVVVASLSNPFYTELVEAIDREAARAGFSIFLASTDRDVARERQVVSAMLQKGVDGLVFAHVATTDRKMLREATGGTAFVLASRHFARSADDYVVVDGKTGSELAVRHLVELGHRRIGLIAGPRSVMQFRWRRQGYLNALAEAGIEPDDALVVQARGTGWLGAGREAVDALLELPRSRRPTALHASNDLLALGALQRAHELHIRVPEELSIVGFDNIAFGAISVVPLTTVDSRIGEIGRRATQLLLARLEERPSAEPAQQVLEPSLVVRGSTGPAPRVRSRGGRR